ncbi:competence protein ComL [Chryseobacterium piperi]|uniref:Competence protein ComL n=1 Tax=Chryseobacterium piperi TaxID=558152 RepID=A0A086BLP0_9FLAO|nr:DUF6759 domain-containing protein [Chryseobacterium piperi]ASW75705.1 competence protein ComL [Chryseobacterium piperi]KFF29854.1 competence protein ComL [Chryseobacterium piperi]
MKNKLALSCGILALSLVSCSVNYNNYPVRNRFPNTTNNTPSTANIEREYSELVKTYKPDTTEVLNSLLNGSSDDNRTSFTVENKSPCNMVLTISGNNFYKKIPIAAGKMGYTMLPKNQNYRLSGVLCRSVYQSTKFISDSYTISLSN